MTSIINDISAQKAARLAGVGYIIIIFLSIFAEFFVRTSLVVPGDASATAANILANELLFRSGVSAYIVVAVFDLMIAVALYVALRQVHRSLSLLAAWLRLAHAVIMAVVVFNLFNVLHLLANTDYLVIYPVVQLHALVMINLDAFSFGWLIGLVFFGMHCATIGYLVYKSGFLPRPAGILLIIAALGYLVDSFAHFMLANYNDYADIFLLIVAIPALVAEIYLTFVLLFYNFAPRSEQATS